jgi:hypothetical protein
MAPTAAAPLGRAAMTTRSRLGGIGVMAPITTMVGSTSAAPAGACCTATDGDDADAHAADRGTDLFRGHPGAGERRRGRHGQVGGMKKRCESAERCGQRTEAQLSADAVARCPQRAIKASRCTLLLTPCLAAASARVASTVRELENSTVNSMQKRRLHFSLAPQRRRLVRSTDPAARRQPARAARSGEDQHLEGTTAGVRRAGTTGG